MTKIEKVLKYLLHKTAEPILLDSAEFSAILGAVESWKPTDEERAAYGTRAMDALKRLNSKA